MDSEDIKRDFPLLEADSYENPRSPKDFNYNCLAFVLGDLHNWWEPPGLYGHYWPPGFAEDVTVETAVAIIRCHGFTEDSSLTVAPESEAIAVYATGTEWSHFAKFRDGVWVSKLGEGNDIAHSTLAGLEGDQYGKVIRVLRRKAGAMK